MRKTTVKKVYDCLKKKEEVSLKIGISLGISEKI